MFHLTYIARELRRRLGRTILTALGLALGVGLVIAIIGVSQGLDEAQDEVLAPLQSVGTDILVTRVAGAQSAAATGTGATTSTTSATGPRGFFRGGPGGTAVDIADIQALEKENSSVATDLSKLGKPGDKFTHDFFLSATLLSFPESALDEIKKVDGVSSATGGLTQLAQHQTGTVPNIVAEIQTGGETVEQDISPPTEAEQQAIAKCLADRGIGPGANRGTNEQPDVVVTPAPGGGGGAVGPGGGAAQCFPERLRRARINTPMRTIQQVVNPPQTDITNASYTAAGVDVRTPKLGLVTAEQLSDGAWLSSNSTNEVLVNVAYANKQSLKVGSKIPINGTDYTVVGLVRPTLTGSTADLYFPLDKLQELASKQDRLTTVLVKAKDAGSVDKVAAQIRKILPGAEVVTTKSLANSVTGSLSNAQDLADNVGFAVGAIVLVSAFVIAALLTLSSIGKRVREIGTLRAVGWSKGRVVRQLLGETMGIGVVGGILGLGVGAAVAAAISVASPSLSATTAGVPSAASSSLSQFFNQASTAATTTQVKLSAPLSPTTLALGVLFALVGGLVAGLIGSWRAARLSPSVALRDLG